jgi:hypothetical protein
MLQIGTLAKAPSLQRDTHEKLTNLLQQKIH